MGKLWYRRSHDESFALHAALAAQMESQQLEISSLRAEMAAQADARNAEAVAAEQAALGDTPSSSTDTDRVHRRSTDADRVHRRSTGSTDGQRTTQTVNMTH